MSYKNLKFKKWINPSTKEVRYYINTEFVDHRIGMALANSAYIINDSGKAKVCWKGITYDGEGRMYAMMEVNKYLTNQETLTNKFPYLSISFAEFEDRWNQCLTKSGNFSFTQYDRKFG